MVVVTPIVPSFDVAQLKRNSNHFAQRHQKKDIQKLLQEKQDLSGWKRNESNDGYKQIMLVTQEVPTE